MDNKIVLISEFTQLIKHKSLTFRMKKNPNHQNSCDHQNTCIPGCNFQQVTPDEDHRTVTVLEP